MYAYGTFLLCGRIKSVRYRRLLDDMAISVMSPRVEYSFQIHVLLHPNVTVMMIGYY